MFILGHGSEEISKYSLTVAESRAEPELLRMCILRRSMGGKVKSWQLTWPLVV
jgi:hypothetical protein